MARHRRHDGVYQVSDQGQVRNTQTSKVLQPVKMKNGRLYVTLSSSGFQRKCTVHGLVAALTAVSNARRIGLLTSTFLTQARLR